MKLNEETWIIFQMEIVKEAAASKMEPGIQFSWLEENRKSFCERWSWSWREGEYLITGPLYNVSDTAPIIDINVPATFAWKLELLQSIFAFL